MLALAQVPTKPPDNPNAAAKALAQRLGKERNVEGLQTILEARNTDLLAAYEGGLRHWSMGDQKRPVALPPGIEALMVKHYADPVVGGPLRSLCAANGTVYRSRQLFDLFFAEWRSRRIRPSTYPMYDSALQTDQPGVEQPLLDWLAAADAPASEDRRRILYFLGARRYLPAVEPLAATLRKGGDPDAIAVASALIQLGAQPGIEAVIDSLPVFRSQPPRDNPEAWSHLASRIAGLPATIPIPYTRFRAVLPEGERRYSLAWLGKRRDLDAVPDALAYMAEPGGYPAALEVLIATDSPEVWKRTRAEVERLKGEGRLNEGQYRYASTRLDDKILGERRVRVPP